MLWNQILVLLLMSNLPENCESSHCHEWKIFDNDMAETITEPGNPCPEEPRCNCLITTVRTREVTNVDCKNRRLTAIPKLPNNTYTLDLSQNLIQTLNNGAFMNYTILNTLNLAGNILSELNEETFVGLRSLMHLSLRDNHIRYTVTSIPSRVFKLLGNLTRLDIMQNLPDFSGEDYKLEAFEDLPKLTHLYIDGIPDKNLGDILTYLPSLKSIHFGHFSPPRRKDCRCFLPNLTKDFFPEDTSISEVDLSFCKIERIEARVFEPLKHLSYLDLSHNENLKFASMKNISDGLESTNITVLKLNQVHSIWEKCVEITKDHVEGFNKTNLKEIYLESNKISVIDKKAVAYIPRSLEVVSLKDNIIMLGVYIYEILQRVDLLDHLQKVDISDQNRNHFMLRWKRDKENETIQQVENVLFENNKYGNRSVVTKHAEKLMVNNRMNATIQKTQPDLIAKLTATQLSRWLTSRHNATTEIQQVHRSPDNKQPSVSKGTISLVLPKNLNCLDASNMKVRLELRSVTFEPNKLQKLFLSRNTFFHWYGPFKGLGNLTKLDLSWNACSDMNLTTFHFMPNLRVLNLSINFLDIPLNRDHRGTIFRNQEKLEVLTISDNKLRSLPRNIFSGLKNLKQLFLAKNLLNTFDVDLSHMNRLAGVNLHENQLETISEAVRDVFDRQALTANLSVKLERNNFKCDCENIDFIKWIADSPVTFINKQHYQCFFKDRSIGNLMNARQIFKSLEKECYNYTPIIVSSTSALVLALSLIATTIVYRFRWNLRYMYYMAKYKANTPSRKGYESIESEDINIKDVNVSYADEDSGFIRQKIYTELEVNRGLKLHIRDRDAPIAAVSENIVDAIERCQRTLIILSKAYLTHKWCIFEMNMAGIKALKTDTRLLCVLMLEDVPHKDLPLKIMKIIKDQEHLEYPGDQNLEDCFWDRLKASLVDS